MKWRRDLKRRRYLDFSYRNVPLLLFDTQRLQFNWDELSKMSIETNIFYAVGSLAINFYGLVRFPHALIYEHEKLWISPDLLFSKRIHGLFGEPLKTNRNEYD